MISDIRRSKADHGRVLECIADSGALKRSNLSEFFSILQNVFAREPPVVARQEYPQAQHQSSQKQENPPPIPPLPPELGIGRPVQGVRQSEPPAGQWPPPPPPKEYDGNTSAQRSGSQTQVEPNPSRPNAGYSSPPYDYERGYAQAPQPMRQAIPEPGTSSNYNHSERNLDHHFSRPEHPQLHQGLGSPLASEPNARRQNSYPQNMINANQQLQPHQAPPPVSFGHPTRQNRVSYGEGNRHIQNHPVHQQLPPSLNQQRPYIQQAPPPPKSKPPEDLLTSPFENPLPTEPANIAPPPIPPNPQKDALLSALSQTLTQQIHPMHNSNVSALTPLRAQQAAITSTLNAVNAETYQLNDLEVLLTSNEAILHKAMRDADKVLEDAKRRKVPDIDEVLVAPTLVAGQLYQLVAEERAIVESRGILGKALDRGRIGSGVWAKVIVDLSVL